VYPQAASPHAHRAQAGVLLAGFAHSAIHTHARSAHAHTPLDQALANAHNRAIGRAEGGDRAVTRAACSGPRSVCVVRER
jgi:hypothetical protein